MAKDYLKIVLDGCIKNESEFWKSYFFREFKVAEKEHYQANEFFNGCLKIAEAFEHDVKKQYWDRKTELLFQLNGVKDGTIDSENPKDTIEYCETELREIKENDFYVQLRVIPMGVHIFYNHILKIKDAISEAFQMVKNETAKTLISEPQQRNYIIPNDQQMTTIFVVCKSTIDCDYSTFREGIETANFHLLKIKKQTFVKDLTYRLSNIMGNDWYSNVCKGMNWKKSNCSGQGAKLEDNKMTKDLNRILARPGK